MPRRKETYCEFIEREYLDEKEIIFFEKEDVAVYSPKTKNKIMAEDLQMRWIYDSPYELFWRLEVISNKRGLLHTSYAVTDYEEAYKMCNFFAKKLNKSQEGKGKNENL